MDIDTTKQRHKWKRTLRGNNTTKASTVSFFIFAISRVVNPILVSTRLDRRVDVPRDLAQVHELLRETSLQRGIMVHDLANRIGYLDHDLL